MSSKSARSKEFQLDSPTFESKPFASPESDSSLDASQPLSSPSSGSSSRLLEKSLDCKDEEKQLLKDMCSVKALELLNQQGCPHSCQCLQWKSHAADLNATGPGESQNICGMHPAPLMKLCSLIDPLVRKVSDSCPQSGTTTTLKLLCIAASAGFQEETMITPAGRFMPASLVCTHGCITAAVNETFGSHSPARGRMSGAGSCTTPVENGRKPGHQRVTCCVQNNAM